MQITIVISSSIVECSFIIANFPTAGSNFSELVDFLSHLSHAKYVAGLIGELESLIYTKCINKISEGKIK